MDPFAFADIADADQPEGGADEAAAAATKLPAVGANAALAAAPGLAATTPAVGAPAAAAALPATSNAAAAAALPAAGAASNGVISVDPWQAAPAATTPNNGMWTPTSMATLSSLPTTALAAVSSTAALSSSVLTSAISSSASLSSTPSSSRSSTSASTSSSSSSSTSSSSPSPTPTVTEKDVGQSGWALPVVIPIACVAGMLLLLSIFARLFSIASQNRRRRREAAAALARKLDHEGGDPDDSTAELAANMDIGGARFGNKGVGDTPGAGGGGETPSRFSFGFGKRGGNNNGAGGGHQEAEQGYNDAELLGVPASQPQGAGRAWSWVKNTFTNEQSLGEQTTRGPPAKKSILSFVNLTSTPASPPGFSMSDDPWRQPQPQPSRQSVSSIPPSQSAAAQFGWCDVSLSPPPPTPPPKFPLRKAPPPRSPLSTVTEERSLLATMSSSPSRAGMSTVGKGVVRSPFSSSPLAANMSRDAGSSSMDGNVSTSAVQTRLPSDTYRRVSRGNGDDDDDADLSVPRRSNGILREEESGVVSGDLPRSNSTVVHAPLRRGTTTNRRRFDAETLTVEPSQVHGPRGISPLPPYEETPHAEAVINFNGITSPGASDVAYLSPVMPLPPRDMQLQRNGTADSDAKRRHRLGRARTIVDHAVQASNAERLKRAASAAPGSRRPPVAPASGGLTRTSTLSEVPSGQKHAALYESTRDMLQVETPIMPGSVLTRRSSGSAYSDGVPSLSEGEEDSDDGEGGPGTGSQWRTPATSVRDAGRGERTARQGQQDDSDDHGEQLVFTAASKALLSTPFADSARSTPKYLDAIAAYYTSPNAEEDGDCAAFSPYGNQAQTQTQTTPRRTPTQRRPPPPRIELHDAPVPLPSPYESRASSPTRGSAGTGSPTRQWKKQGDGKWAPSDAPAPSPFGKHANLFFSPGQQQQQRSM